ncbi:MAG: helix-turn-helix domain-containing protein, partial [Armatimonadota bacterium]|nr:helix-turn-helix domain-containing protein [Armatimonadota bacterium]
IREGKLPASRIGKSYRVRKVDLAVFLEVSRVRPVRRPTAGVSPPRRTPRSQRPPETAQESRPMPAPTGGAQPPVGEVRRERPGPEEITGHPLERVLSGLH